MSIREVEVQTLGELIDRVTPSEPEVETGRRRYSGVYHGSPRARWPLLTSLDRLGGVEPPHSKRGLEEHILRNFIRSARPYLDGEPENDWEHLAVAQHHGVPTRLLDWSYSPLIALYFALRHDTGEDRVLWSLDWQRMHRHFDFPEIAFLIRDLAEISGGEPEFTPWELFRQGRRGGGEKRPFALMLDPPALSQRIVSQAGVFTLSTSTEVSFDRFLEEQGLSGALTRYLIPRERAELFRDQLDLVGMDERRLFPDLDGVAAQLRRYYS